MDFVLGVLASLVANVVPAIHDAVERNKTLKEKLYDCLKKAVDQWSATKEVKQSTLLNPVRYTSKLKDYIEHPEKGMHPLDKELMQLWVDAIKADGDCSAYILAIKEDLILANQNEGFKHVLTLLEKMLQEQEEIKRKIDELWSRGGKNVRRYWDSLSIFDGGKKQLPYTSIMGGRVPEAEAVWKACETPELVVVEAQSQLEAKAFATAAILDNGGEVESALVVENNDLYDQLVNGEKRRIIITSVPANHQLAVAKGHSVIYCVGPQDNYTTEHVVLPDIDRDVFVSSLKEAGIGDDEARRMALDSAKDINMLWRMLGIVIVSPVWETPENIKRFIPIMMVGQWDELCEADKMLLADICGYKKYDELRKALNDFIITDESPLKKIVTVYAVKSPYALFKRYFKYVTDAAVEEFLVYADLVLDDVDPDAIKKMKTEELQFWRNNRTFSSSLRKGIVEGLTLISLMREENHQDNQIERWMSEKFKGFDLQRYLSHKYNLLWMAEAAPKAFLQYIENDIQSGSVLLNDLFVVRSDQFSITGTQVNYLELLTCLECIAWSEDYLPQVTQILLHMCAYPNSSNYVNRPSNTLYNIYRFVLPCTLATLEKRVTILKIFQKRYPQAIHVLCKMWLKGLKQDVWHPSPYFRWRWVEQKPELPKRVTIYPSNDVLREVYDLMMADFPWTEEAILDLLDLSTERCMQSLRQDIIIQVRAHIDEIRGNDAICDALRKEIYRHIECPDTVWALPKKELEIYRELLQDLTPTEIVQANKHFFENIFIYNPELGLSYKNDNQVVESRKLQAKIEEEIIKEKGLEGIWELAKVAKSPEAVACGFVELTEDHHRTLVYELYCKGELGVEFIRRYFSNLFYRHREEDGLYTSYITEMMAINSDKIGVLLYAPEFQRVLANIAEEQPETIWYEYWQNVYVGAYEKDDVEFIAQRLFLSKRYGYLLHIMTREMMLTHLSNKTKVDLLYAISQTDGVRDMMRDGYCVAKILSTVDTVSDADMELKVEQMEFYLYEYLEHYWHGERSHLKKAINTKPELMMEIYKSIFKPDEGFSDEGNESIEYKQFKARISYSFLDKYWDVPCTDENGNIDGEKLKAYLKRIDELAHECHRVSILPLIIGKILGNFPENEDYPSQLLCDLVEEFHNDDIDDEIGHAIHNRRRFSSRSPFEGGTVERRHIETMQKYRENAMLRSFRFVKILDNAIASFEHDAKRNDFEGQMNNFEY